MTYNQIAVIFDVVPSTIISWVRKYLPDEFLRRHRERGVWRDAFLPDLQRMCNGEHTFEDIGRFFGVGPGAARVWVQKYLSDTAYQMVLRKRRQYTIDPDTIQEMVRMRTDDGATLTVIASFFGFGLPKVFALLKDVVRGTPDIDEQFCGDVTFLGVEPSDADIESIQRQIDSGVFSL